MSDSPISSQQLRELRCIGIVNRGEAALRCIRTVKSMRARDGIDLRCLALFTDVDRNAPFVRQADAALRLTPPGATAVSAYLDADGLLDALRRGGADAVWPGWGFVAEDAEFADRAARATRSANSASSARKPQPGQTASAPPRRSASIRPSASR